MLIEPQNSPYDLSFDLLGFPVRVHPGFFVLPVVFGAGWAGAAENPGVVILIFIAVFFASILVHELGHSIALKHFGVPSRIVLYWMGGLAIHESSAWGGARRLTPNQQIVVSLAGPFAGFALAAVVVGIIVALSGSIEFAWNGIFPQLLPIWSDSVIASNQYLKILLSIFLLCNIFWNVLNLAPVIPLDGGRVCQEICTKADYQNGMRNALLISVVAGALIALAGFMNQDNFVGIFFALMAISAWMTLQQMMGRSQGRW